MALILLLLLVGVGGGFTGCKTTHKTPTPSAARLSPAAPRLDEIVADLRANDEALNDVRAAATFTLESPKMEAIQRFPSGAVAYRRPADLYVEGKNGFSATLFKLTSSGPDFLIEFPAVQDVDDRYYCSSEAEDIANVPFTVAPADVAREMFMPIDWKETSDKDMRLIEYDDATGQATLEFIVMGDMVRRLDVQGTPWIIMHNTLNDRDGTTLSDTKMSDYTENGGVRFPSKMEAWFPGERTRLTFELRNVRINTGLPDSKFYIKWPAGQ